jgi:hypothetical protein
VRADSNADSGVKVFSQDHKAGKLIVA